MFSEGMKTLLFFHIFRDKSGGGGRVVNQALFKKRGQVSDGRELVNFLPDGGTQFPQ